MSSESAFQPRDDANPIRLAELFSLDDAQFRTRFRSTPLWRARRRGVLRNAAIVLGNQADPASLPALSAGLNDSEPLVRATCAWALGRLPDHLGQQALQTRLPCEDVEDVIAELRSALRHATNDPTT